MLTIKIMTILLLSAFYLIYFLKMFLLKRQNIKGNILGKGKKSRESFLIETFLRFVTLFGALVQFASAIWDKAVWGLPVFSAVQIIGLIFMSLGTAIFLFAVINMRTNWRAGYNDEQDTQLVTDGIYKFSRNPAFAGFDLLYIGCALTFPNIINITFSLTAVAMFHIQILGEEKFLVEKFGKAYLDYKASVRRYL